MKRFRYKKDSRLNTYEIIPYVIKHALELDIKAIQHTGKCISYKLSDQELEKYKILVMNKLKKH